MLRIYIIYRFSLVSKVRGTTSRKSRELFTRTFPGCAFFLCNKKKSGFPNSMTGTHRAAIMTQASWIVVWPGNMYSEQPSRTWLWPRSIILINVINIDGAQPGVYAMSIKQWWNIVKFHLETEKLEWSNALEVVDTYLARWGYIKPI